MVIYCPLWTESSQAIWRPGEASADTSTYSPSDSYRALCFWQPSGSKGLLFLGSQIPVPPPQVANIIKSQPAARRRREIEGGEQEGEERNITMAIFPVSCPSEPNQIFYYITLQFLPPISLGGPRASLELLDEEMFPLQPSVVTGGHIGNQSRNRRRAQRAGPPALDRLFFGQELPRHRRSIERWTCRLHTHKTYIHTNMCQCIWVNLIHTGNTSQHIFLSFSRLPRFENVLVVFIQKHQSRSESEASTRWGIGQQWRSRDIKEPKPWAYSSVRKINSAKLKGKKMPIRKINLEKAIKLARTPSEDSRQLIHPLLKLSTASLWAGFTEHSVIFPKKSSFRRHFLRPWLISLQYSWSASWSQLRSCCWDFCGTLNKIRGVIHCGKRENLEIWH